MVSRTLLFAVLGLLVKHWELVASQVQYEAWIIDPRCPDEGRRLLLQESNDKETRSMTEERGVLQSRARRATEDHMDRPNRELFVGNTNPVTFNLKLHWEPGYCWQREWNERPWCLECPGSTCEDLSALWINVCNQYNSRQRFEWVQLGIDPTTSQGVGLLKVQGQDLCLEQVVPRSFRLRPCDEFSPNQKLVGFHISNPFQLRPHHIDHLADCLTQDHHPKPYEELISQPCSEAVSHKTSYWEVYQPSETLVTLRMPACSANLPCEECQGDCSTDSDCSGTLRCFQRAAANAAQSIPGCAGVPLAHYADYCYDPLRK